MDFWGGGGRCLFTFFTFVNILLVDLFFVSFFVFSIRQIQNHKKNP
jgi:hypothetical protein